MVYTGNNPQVIENALKKRNCWAPVPNDKYPLQAHLLWKNLNFPPKFYSEAEELLKINPNRSVSFFIIKLLLNHF